MRKSTAIVILLLLLGSIGCGKSESNPEEKSTSIQPETVKSAQPNSIENTESTSIETPQPNSTENTQQSPTENTESTPIENTQQSPTENTEPTPTENTQQSAESAETQTPESADRTVETPEFNPPTPSPTSPAKSEDSTNSSPVDTPNQPDSDPIPTEHTFKADEEPIVPVGNFDFQLKQASLKKELIDSSTQKNYSTQSAQKPSYYLFVELDLTNRSDRTAFDLFRYHLDCGDGKPLANAADAAVAYRNNRNLNLFAQIEPGETGTVADGFLVPESCLNSDDMTLNISSAGEGKGKVPVRLK